MRLKFSRTPDLQSYLAEDIRVYDGNIVNVPLKRGLQLLKAHSDNFKEFPSPYKNPYLPLQKQGKPLDELTSTPLVSILIPQRARPAQIKRCLELILANTSYPNYEVILICDRDDMDSVKDIPKDKRIKVVVDPSPTRQMFVGKVNYGYKICNGDYLVYLANDIEVGKNWLTEAMKSMLGLFSDRGGLVAFNHGGSDTDASHGLISREFVDRYLGGNILYPDYTHFWSDVELLYITKELNRFHPCLTSKIVHISPKDALHDEAWKKSYESGRQLLVKRQKMGFPVHQSRKISDITIVTLHHWTEEILKQDLLSYLPPGIEYLQFDNQGNKLFSSAAKGFNYGIRKAKNDIVMCVHEDTIFEREWFENFVEQESRLRNWGAIGIVGVDFNSPWHHWGWKSKAPCLAQTLDECCIIINKKNNIWFDEETFDEWHRYGVDFCLQARDKGLDVYIMNGPGFHDDTQKTYSLPEGWQD